MDTNYFDEFEQSVTICDTNGIVLYMNNKAVLTFEKWGGVQLIGKSLFSCHQPQSVNKIKQIISSGVGNTYTIEKNGIKKLIHQGPWLKNNVIEGVIEISIELPGNIQHKIR